MNIHLPTRLLRSFRTANCKQRTANARRAPRAAFTLIELLIVITIMATLLALLGGGIRKSVDNAKRRRAATEREAVRSAILTFWHDEGKPPIETERVYNTYVFGKKLSEGEMKDRNINKNLCKQDKPEMTIEEVLKPLLNPELNNLKKSYLSKKDVNLDEKDPDKQSIKRIIIYLTSKNAKVE